LSAISSLITTPLAASRRRGSICSTMLRAAERNARRDLDLTDRDGADFLNSEGDLFIPADLAQTRGMATRTTTPGRALHAGWVERWDP
jgi:hypothetical protein